MNFHKTLPKQSGQSGQAKPASRALTPAPNNIRSNVKKIRIPKRPIIDLTLSFDLSIPNSLKFKNDMLPPIYHWNDEKNQDAKCCPKKKAQPTFLFALVIKPKKFPNDFKT